MSRKLRLNFDAHSIEVLTNYPLCQVLQKPEASGRLLKRAIKLGQFDVNYRPRTTTKGKAFTDFIAEFTYADTTEVTGTTINAEAAKVLRWEIVKRLQPDKRKRTDGSSMWMMPLMRISLGPT